MSARAPWLPALVLITGISPLATDMYLSALPAMTRDLHSSAATMSLTLTAFLIGFAAGLITVGPISDAFGRKPFLLGGSLLFAVLSLACAAAPNGPVLVAIRFAQGLASAGGAVCGRAVITDYYGHAADRRQSAVIAAGLIAPVIAPGIGGAILTVTTWRTIFLVLAVIGVIMVAGAAFAIPETLPRSARHPAGASATAGRMASLLRDRLFMPHVVTGALATCGFFAYIGGSSFVLQEHYRVSESLYSVVFATNATAMVATSTLSTVLIVSVGAPRLRTTGLSIALAATAALLTSALGGFDSLALTWVLLACVTAGMGMVLPCVFALGQRAGRRYPGTAAALQGGIQFAAGALLTPVANLLGAHSLTPMAALMFGFMLLALGFVLVHVRRRPAIDQAGRGQASNL